MTIPSEHRLCKYTNVNLTVTSLGTVTSGNVDAILPTANQSTAGIQENATTAEVDAGSSTTRTITPGVLGDSVFGEKAVSIQVFDGATDTATGDGKAYFSIPSSLNGMDLVEVFAAVVTAGTTNTTDIQIHNLTQAADMLSTVITIDSGETTSATAATPAVIDTANDGVSTNDIIRLDVDAVSTTAAKGLIVTLVFRLP